MEFRHFEKILASAKISFRLHFFLNLFTKYNLKKNVTAPLAENFQLSSIIVLYNWHQFSKTFEIVLEKFIRAFLLWNFQILKNVRCCYNSRKFCINGSEILRN